MSETLRQRQRLEAMRRIQQVAVEAFSESGFENVTVDEVAQRAGVSPVSIYRWFGTKEALVLWDEYDPPLFASIGDRLGSVPTLEAVRAGLMQELDRMYDGERALVLQRTRLTIREPDLLAASMAQQSAMAEGLAALFADQGVEGGRLEHRVVAGAAVGVLTACVMEWAITDGSTSLGELVDRGFDSLRGALCGT